MIEMGTEFRQLRELRADEDALVQESVVGPTGDLNETNLAVQWSTTTDYLGYVLLLQTGFRLSRQSLETIEMMDLEVDKKSTIETGTTTFITIYAGVEQ